MTTFVFWNIRKRALQDKIASLCHQHEVDMLILAESEISDATLLVTLNRGRERKFRRPFNLSQRLSFFTRFPAKSLKPVRDAGGIAIRRLRPPIGMEILLVVVHLPSKLYYKPADQASECARLAQAIREAEAAAGHTRTVIVGDLNMNPFEEGVVGADGLHGVMDRRIAQRLKRTVKGQDRDFFYNPMWGRMGDNSTGPPGTYYYDDASYVNLFWHTFDQVLIRPTLLEYFVDDGLQVLCSAGEETLLTPGGQPNTSKGSDHLPLLFKIDIERGIVDDREKSVG